MAEFVYTMNNLKKVHPGKVVIEDLTLSFLPGAKIGVLGANGTGKSTLLRIMAGEDKDFTGEARPKQGLTVGYVPQEPQLDPDKTVRENVEEAVSDQRELLQKFEDLSMKLGEPMDDDAMDKLMAEHGRVQDEIEAKNAWDLETTLERAMDALRCPPGDSPVTNLSGGEKRRVALCQTLLAKPDMLLLDEPTNHLDAETVAWLELHLEQFPGTVVAVTHDRYFLDNVAGWILEMDRGQGFPYQGNYTNWLEQKSKRLAVEEKHKSARRRTLERELEWVRQSPKARQAKSKARLQAYEQMRDEHQRAEVSGVEIYIPDGPRLGSLVVEAEGLKKSYGDKMLFDNLNFKLPPAGIVGIVGPNGAGKTTLFRILTGQEEPDSGSLKVGDTVAFSYVDQSRDSLDNERTLVEELGNGQEQIFLGKKAVNVRAYASSFNFKGSDQQKLVGSLSGGERNRLHLAKLLQTEGNVLLLDEPSNDLDVDTLRALEQAVLDFAGCVVVISHDRWFLDRICTHILAFEGDSQVTYFEGNFEDYEKDKKKRLGADALVPRRIKYRKLTAD